MAKKDERDERGPGYSKAAVVITIIVMIGMVFMIIAGFGAFGEFNIWRIVIGAAVLVICVGFLFHARWARFLAGIGLIGAGLFLAGAIVYRIIAAGPFTLPGYQDPFEDMPPLMAVLMIFLGLGIAGAGLAMIAFVFEKKKLKPVEFQTEEQPLIPPSSLRTDGVYRAREGNPSYFRFFSDGSVTSIISTYPPVEVFRSLDAQSSGALRGTYSISKDGKEIVFTLFNPSLDIANFIYNGTIKNESMWLELNHIMKDGSGANHSSLTIDFIPVGQKNVR